MSARRWNPENPHFEVAVRAYLDELAYANWLGFTSEIEAGAVALELPVRPALTQHDDVVQGGVIGSLIDLAGAAAIGTLQPAGGLCLTLDYTVKLLRPARVSPLRAVGRVTHNGGTFSSATVEVFTAEDLATPCAVGLVSTRNVRAPGGASP